MKNKVRKPNKAKSIVLALLFVLCSIFAALGLTNVSPTATYADGAEGESLLVCNSTSNNLTLYSYYSDAAFSSGEAAVKIKSTQTYGGSHNDLVGIIVDNAIGQRTINFTLENACTGDNDHTIKIGIRANENINDQFDNTFLGIESIVGAEKQQLNNKDCAYLVLDKGESADVSITFDSDFTGQTNFKFSPFAYGQGFNGYLVVKNITFGEAALSAQDIEIPEDVPEDLLDFLYIEVSDRSQIISLSAGEVTEEYPFGVPYINGGYYIGSHTNSSSPNTAWHDLEDIHPVETNFTCEYLHKLTYENTIYPSTSSWADYYDDDRVYFDRIEEYKGGKSIDLYRKVYIKSLIKRPAAEQLLEYGEDSYYVRLRAAEYDTIEIYIPDYNDKFLDMKSFEHYPINLIAVDTVPMTAYNDGHFDSAALAGKFVDGGYSVTHYIYIRDFESVKGNYITLTADLFGEDVAVMSYRYYTLPTNFDYDEGDPVLKDDHHYSEVRYNDDVVVLTIDDHFYSNPSFVDFNASTEDPSDPDPVDPEPVDPQPEDPQPVNYSIFDGSIENALGSTGTKEFEHYTANWIGFQGETSFVIDTEVAEKAYTQAWRSGGKSNDSRYLKLNFDANVASFSVKVVAKSNSNSGTVNIGAGSDTYYNNNLIATVGTVNGSEFSLIESESISVDSAQNYYLTFSNSVQFAEITLDVTLIDDASSDPEDPSDPGDPGDPGDPSNPENPQPDDPIDIIVHFEYQLNAYDNVTLQRSDYDTRSEFLDALRAAYRVVEDEDIEALEFIGYTAEYEGGNSTSFVYESLMDLASSSTGVEVTLTSDWFVKISFRYEIPETVLLADNFKANYSSARPVTSDFDPSKVVWSEEEGKYVYDGTYTVDDDPYFRDYTDLLSALMAEVSLNRTYEGDYTYYQEFPSLFNGFQQYYVDEYTFNGWKVPEFCEEYFENGYFTVEGLDAVMRQVFTDNSYDDILELYPNGIDVVLLADMDVSVYDPVAPVSHNPDQSEDKPAEQGDHTGDSSGSTETTETSSGKGNQTTTDKSDEEGSDFELHWPTLKQLWQVITHPWKSLKRLWKVITHPKKFFEALKRAFDRASALDWAIIIACSAVFIGLIILAVKLIKRRR